MTILAQISTLKFLGLKPVPAKRAPKPLRRGTAKIHVNVPSDYPLSPPGLELAPAIPIGAVLTLRDRLDIDESRAAALAGLSERTYHRRKKDQSALSPSEADATLRSARILEQAINIFGDEVRAVSWLKSPSNVLGGIPLDLIASDAGAQAVQDELVRIHWGDVA